ncbi:hypothetical protein CK936_14525 [Streptomyces albireticuli]|uniref:Uncharacterized protein n=1 Tax=Streptomyces albireticuli TaxID=1940 RepID=A0A2A2D9S3_9ACTN|nr:polyprenyl synthetase family protein [Streptomyces albireticuli]PAU48264.1 hypothetical protein CK936_14525 [Streptomyces albireticuli]
MIDLPCGNCARGQFARRRALAPARFRPGGWQTGGADAVPAGLARRGPQRPAVQVAALELFHSFALIHDDLMDDSDTRRDPLALHRLLTDRHCDSYRPDAAASRFGAAAAC